MLRPEVLHKEDTISVTYLGVTSEKILFNGNYAGEILFNIENIIIVDEIEKKGTRIRTMTQYLKEVKKSSIPNINSIWESDYSVEIIDMIKKENYHSTGTLTIERKMNKGILTTVCNGNEVESVKNDDIFNKDLIEKNVAFLSLWPIQMNFFTAQFSIKEFNTEKSLLIQYIGIVDNQIIYSFTTRGSNIPFAHGDYLIHIDKDNRHVIKIELLSGPEYGNHLIYAIFSVKKMNKYGIVEEMQNEFTISNSEYIFHVRFNNVKIRNNKS